MNFLYTYGLFLAEIVTTVIAILIVLSTIISIAGKNRNRSKEKIEINKINDKYDAIRSELREQIYDKSEFKKLQKQEKEKAKKTKKLSQRDEPNYQATANLERAHARRRIFVLNFYGDIKASEADCLREEVTAILTVASPKDEVLVKIESEGGAFHSYGFAASQLKRIRDRSIPLLVSIDKVAASGGYMMACVANRILAAPFAVLGSIGVVAQLPNFNRLLKKHDIDFEQITAGEYKRTLTMFGENTSKGRKKFQEELDEAHELFKSFVATNRPVVNINNIATGEYWYGTRAKELRLVDDIITSDDYLLSASEKADIYEIIYSIKKNWSDKIPILARKVLGSVFKKY